MEPPEPSGLHVVFDGVAEPDVRVVVADDHALVTIGLEAVLPSLTNGRVTVVGATRESGHVLDVVLDNKADVALIDLNMPGPGGLHAIREVVEQSPSTAVLAVSGVASMDQALVALAAGASGFVPKAAGPETLVEPIMIVARGGCVLPKSLLTVLVRSAVGAASRQVRNMTEKQITLLRLVASGRNADQMAQEMFVSTRTLKRNLSALYEQLGVSTRQEAAAFAGRSGLLDGDPVSLDQQVNGPSVV